MLWCEMLDRFFQDAKDAISLGLWAVSGTVLSTGCLGVQLSWFGSGSYGLAIDPPTNLKVCSCRLRIIPGAACLFCSGFWPPLWILSQP